MCACASVQGELLLAVCGLCACVCGRSVDVCARVCVHERYVEERGSVLSFCVTLSHSVFRVACKVVEIGFCGWMFLRCISDLGSRFAEAATTKSRGKVATDVTMRNKLCVRPHRD